MSVHIFLIIRPSGIRSSRKCEVVPVHAMKHIGGAAIKLHSFSTSALQEASGQFHAQTALYPANNPSIHWIGGWVGCKCWWCGNSWGICHLCGELNPGCHYTDWAFLPSTYSHCCHIFPLLKFILSLIIPIFVWFHILQCGRMSA